MTRTRSTSFIDRLIAESKQATSDLMALRHEIERAGLKRRTYWGGGPGERARLVYDNLHKLADHVHKIWEADIDDDDDAPIVNEKPSQRTLGDGQLRLTSGGR